MKIVDFDQILDTFINNFNRNMMIPIVGSGFTARCQTTNGYVPTGKEYKNHMIASICEKLSLPDSEKEHLSLDSFSSIADIYTKTIDDIDKRNFFVSNFTNVNINDVDKLNFLKINWQYIYTLNIDDGIEKNSDFNHVICCNKKVVPSIFDEFKCVIKLHGDVNELINYGDYESIIFSKKQYGRSLDNNKVLLNKLTHDASYQNLLFIGCSLDDEIDILTYLPEESNTNITNRYICVVNAPSQLDILKYETYGITHVIKFNSYEDMYKKIYYAWDEAQKINCDELSNHKNYEIKHVDDSFEINKSYFLFGKSIINNNTINVPYFFISRSNTEEIIENMIRHPLQFVLGSGYSGKTYVLYDIAIKIRDKDVYVFESKDRIAKKAFDKLFNKNNSLFLFDTNSLTINQIENIIKNKSLLEKNSNKVVIFSSKNDSELLGLIKLLEDNGEITKNFAPMTIIENKLSKKEITSINPKLTATTIGILSSKKTILDNILYLSDSLSSKHKFDKIQLSFGSIKDIATLIILAIEKKVYSAQIIKFDILEQIYNQKLKAYPLIDLEETWEFEKSSGDNSPKKYIINAEYWLFKQLEIYAKDTTHHDNIVNAFKYIISKIIEEEGKPDILKFNNSSYKKYILFDNINKIFRTNGKESLILINKIYSGLNTYLSTDPNYLHQRAKSYIRLASCEDNYDKKNIIFEKSQRDTNLAHQIFEQRFSECGNNKLLISLAHIEYTQAVILCHKCNINKYKDIEENTHAIIALNDALCSPYNSYDYAKNDKINYNNVVSKLFNKTIQNKAEIKDEANSCVENLFKLLRE